MGKNIENLDKCREDMKAQYGDKEFVEWLALIQVDHDAGLERYLSGRREKLSSYWANMSRSAKSDFGESLMKYPAFVDSPRCVKLLARLATERQEIPALAEAWHAIVWVNGEDEESGGPLVAAFGEGLAAGGLQTSALLPWAIELGVVGSLRELLAAYGSAPSPAAWPKLSARQASAADIERKACAAVAADDAPELSKALEGIRAATAPGTAQGDPQRFEEAALRLCRMAGAVGSAKCLGVALRASLPGKLARPDFLEMLGFIDQSINYGLEWDSPDGEEAFEAELAEAIRSAALLSASCESDIAEGIGRVGGLEWGNALGSGLRLALVDFQAREIGDATRQISVEAPGESISRRL